MEGVSLFHRTTCQIVQSSQCCLRRSLQIWGHAAYCCEQDTHTLAGYDDMLSHHNKTQHNKTRTNKKTRTAEWMWAMRRSNGQLIRVTSTAVRSPQVVILVVYGLLDNHANRRIMLKQMLPMIMAWRMLATWVCLVGIFSGCQTSKYIPTHPSEKGYKELISLHVRMSMC